MEPVPFGQRHAISPPTNLAAEIALAIKGKKSLSSMRDAIDTAVAAQKIDANQRADGIRACIAVLAEFPDHAHLFADRVQLCASKTPEDLRNLAKARIAEHEQRIEQERERIRAEEAAAYALMLAEDQRDAHGRNPWTWDAPISAADDELRVMGCAHSGLTNSIS